MTNDPMQALREMRQIDAHEKQLARMGRDDKTDSWDREMRQHLKAMGESLRPANKSEYEGWLRGYILAGNKPTHHYDYEWGRSGDWFVATKDMIVFPLFGARAIKIIVPAGINVQAMDIGHNEVYFYDGFAVRGYCVPDYSDLHL